MDLEFVPVTAKPAGCHPLLKELNEKFHSAFGDDPEFIVQVPGRVNLIGEHIDYCGYSVLPMALQQHILIAVRPSDDEFLKLVNVSDAYPSFEGNINNLSVESSNCVHWYNYVICGIRGVSECSLNNKFKLCGMSMAVAGNILPNSGLSSSSALVCAAALGTAYTNKIKLSRQELASLCAQCERYIGTEGGGMDQAIAFLANEGCAKHISFKPLCASDVKLPSDVAIVVAHCLAEINKAASSQFNCRVAECRLAALVLAHESGLQNWHQLRVLADVQDHLSLDLPTMTGHVKKTLNKDLYTKDEVCTLLGISRSSLERDFLPENTWHIENFKLQQRALHVYEEASRVSEFRKLCNEGGDVHALGHLMNQSHDSLRDLYECSHKQLDALVSIAREAGALGARLTGAGWGGCMVALTTKDKVSEFTSSLKGRFYKQQNLKDKDVDSVVFPSSPCHGAVIFQC